MLSDISIPLPASFQQAQELASDILACALDEDEEQVFHLSQTLGELAGTLIRGAIARWPDHYIEQARKRKAEHAPGTIRVTSAEAVAALDSLMGEL